MNAHYLNLQVGEKVRAVTINGSSLLGVVKEVKGDEIVFDFEDFEPRIEKELVPFETYTKAIELVSLRRI